MSARRYRLTFTSPDGDVFDASSALEIGQLGSISESPETDLSILTHGDMSMTLDNQDGAVETFLQNAGTSDLYDVVLERQLAEGGSWSRLFGGVLDLPYSLTYDDMKKTAHVVAYSYTKALERTPANGTNLRRALADKTASITQDTSTLVFISGETADLEVGDVVRLNDGQNIDEFTVDRVISATQVAVREIASRTYTSVFAQVVTTFFHDRSPVDLLQLVADEAGVEFDNRNIGSPLSVFPIATPYSLAGLNLTGIPRSLVPISGDLTVTFPSSASSTRKTSDGPTATWADGTSSNVALLDWTPYHDSEPGTVTSAMSDFPVADIGFFAPDHSNNWVFWTEGFGGPAHLRRATGGGTGSGTDLGASSIMSTPDKLACCVNDPSGTGVYLSYRNTGGSREFRYYDGTFHTISTAISGWLQIIRYPPGPAGDRLLVMVDDVTKDILFWDLPGRTLGRTMPWFNSTDRILAWTIRSWGDTTYAGGPSKLWFTFLFERYNETWVAVYDARGDHSGWSFVAAYRISSTVSPPSILGTPQIQNTQQSFLTVMKDAAGEEYVAGYAGGQWFVLSTSYDGVIRYADFSDSSCAKAARDIAVILDSVVHFDEFKTMTVVNRAALGGGDVIATLGAPLSSVRRPVSELYRTSVAVSGNDSSGADINEIQGEQGDSARRVSVSSDLITTPGMALACALTTLQFVSQIREQRDVTVEDDGTPLSVFQRVEMDGRYWLVYKLETDLEQEIHNLTLLEMAS